MNFVLEKRHGCKAVVAGREVTIFSSNDYLGLSAHPAVLDAALDAARNFGLGTGGAPGTTGTTIIHEKLAQAIAAFKSRRNAVLFPSGYQANQAIHQALNAPGIVFHVDRRHHPSAIDGIRLAKDSKAVKFDHGDINSLKLALQAERGSTNVVTLPSVFTVDGDIAPLDKLVELKRKFKFVLVLDEAHATGCLGPTGRGLEEHFNLKGTADFIMGTFSKALGSQGGFLAFDDDSRQYLTSGFRTFDYSTSLSAVSAAAALKALELLDSDKSILESLRRARSQIIEQCRAREIPIIANDSMILLLPSDNVDDLQNKLLDDGFLTIPVHSRVEGGVKNCLRIVPMATHTDDDIRSFVSALKKHIGPPNQN